MHSLSLLCIVNKLYKILEGIRPSFIVTMEEHFFLDLNGQQMDTILVLWCSKCLKIFSDFKQHKSKSHIGLTMVKIKVQTSLCSFMGDHFVHYKNSACHGFKTGAFNFLRAISSKSPEAARGLSPVFAHWFLYLREQMGTHPSACQHDSA